MFSEEGGKAVSTMGQCLTDTFTVTSPGSVTPPTICGTNDGQHSNKITYHIYLVNNLLHKKYFVTFL